MSPGYCPCGGWHLLQWLTAYKSVSKSSSLVVSGTSNPHPSASKFFNIQKTKQAGAGTSDLKYLLHLSLTGFPSLHPCFIVGFNCENISTTLISLKCTKTFTVATKHVLSLEWVFLQFIVK